MKNHAEFVPIQLPERLVPVRRHLRLTLLLAFVTCGKAGPPSPDRMATASFQQEYSRCPDGRYRSHWWTTPEGKYFEELENPLVGVEAYALRQQDSLQEVSWRGITRLTADSRRWFRQSAAPDAAGTGGWSALEAPAFDVVLPLRLVGGAWEGPDWGLLHDGEVRESPPPCAFTPS